MFAQERQQKIVEFLKERSSISVPELEKFLDASPATVRRDLGFLEDAGKIVRTHGGVLPRNHGDGEVSYDRKSRQELSAKKAIAEKAASFAKDGDTVFVDSGSTAFMVGMRLIGREKIEVFTNSVPLLSEARTGGCRVVSLGGEVRAVSLALVGAESLNWMRRIRFDVAFVGASGIDPERGPCTTELGESGVKGAAIRNARRSILVADGSKWEKMAPINFADWQDLDDVVTDHRSTAIEQSILSSQKVRVSSGQEMIL